MLTPPAAFENKRFLNLCRHVIWEYLIISCVVVVLFGLYNVYRGELVWPEIAIFIAGILGPIVGALFLRFTSMVSASVVFTNAIGIFLVFLYSMLTDGISSPALPLVVAFLVMAGGYGNTIVSVAISAMAFLSISVLYVLSDQQMLPQYQIQHDDIVHVRFLGLLAFVVLVSVALYFITSVRKTHDKKLSSALDQALVANEAKSQFLANMSHELRTPLNAIIGFSDILKNQTLGPIENKKYVEYGDDINASGQHLLQLINDILDISVIESKSAKLVETEIDTNALVNSCLSMLRERSTIAGIALRDELSPDLPNLFADETRVKQILLNLIGNALKFTPFGCDVVVRAYVEPEGALIFEVEDSGIGIDEKDIVRITEPYEQIREIETSSNNGVGLGLFITNRLIKLHGGTLDIKSSPGIGTNVIVRFPKERVLERNMLPKVNINR